MNLAALFVLKNKIDKFKAKYATIFLCFIKFYQFL